MTFQEPLTVIGPITVSIPLLVTLVICVVARREGSAIPARALSALVIATIAAIAVSVFFPNPIAIVSMTAASFVAFGVPVMRALERSASERITDAPVRSAELLPRHVGMYVPLWFRSASFVAGLALLCWVVLRVATVAGPRTMAIGFTFAAITFYALYEAWIRQEIFSVRAGSNDDRHRRVRAIFAAQVILLLSFLIMAALSIGTWPGLVPLGVIAALIGGVGCAFALSTGIQERYLQAWSARR